MPCIRRFALPGNPVILLPKGWDAGVSRQSSPKRPQAPLVFGKVPRLRIVAFGAS